MPAHSRTDHTWGFSFDFTYTQSSTTKTSLGFSGLSLMTPSSSLSAFPIFFLALVSFPSSSFPHPSAVVVGNGEGAGTLLQLGARVGTGNTPLLLHAAGAARDTAFIQSAAEPLPGLGLSTSVPSSGSYSGVSPERSSASVNSGLKCSLCSSRSRF